VVVRAQDSENRWTRRSGDGDGWEDFNLPSRKMTIGDEQGDGGYISSAPSNSTNKNEGTKRGW
jgi:hypothetical protein